MARHQRLRIWQRGDDATLWAECSTNPAHATPYLFANDATAEEEADFVKGSASISEVSLQILDKRTNPADQDTGWFTAKLAVNGFSAIIGGLAIWDEEVSTGVWRTLIRGVLGTPALADDVTYQVSIRDIRERERKKKGFTQVTTSTVLPPGTVNGYGLRADGSWMIPPVVPLTGTYRESHLGVVLDVDPGDVPHALFATDRKRRAGTANNGVFDKVAVVWRPISGGAWTTVENMPAQAAGGGLVFVFGQMLGGGLHGSARINGERVNVEYIGNVYLASTNPAELPADGTDVEVYVRYVGPPSEDYPEHLEGTFGEMLQTVCDAHDIEYDSARMAELAEHTPRGRIRITKPVDDLRSWIEKQLLRPMGLAPRLNEDFELSPVSANLPDESVALVAIGASDIIDGDASWVHSDRRVNAIDFDVIYESYGADPLQESAAGDGVTEDRRTFERLHGVALNAQLEDRIHYDQDTVRAEASRFTDFVEQNAPRLTNPILNHREALLFDRYPVGAQVFEALVTGTVGDQLRIGTWASIAIPWLPDYTTGERGTNRIGQVARRQRQDEKAWRVWLEDGGPNSVPVGMPTLGTVTVNPNASASIIVSAVVAGTEARVEYAVADEEPAVTSGEWATVGRVSAPATLTVENLTEGKTLYVRARGEKEARRPSAWTATVATAIPVRARLLAFTVTQNPDGTFTAAWTPNAYTEGVRLHYAAHARGSEPTFALSVDVDVDDGSYTFPASIALHELLAIDGEPWTGFDGTNVTGTAGVRRRVTIETVAPPSNLAFSFLYTQEVHATGEEGLVQLHPSIRVSWTASPDAHLSHYELRYRNYINPLDPGDWINAPNPGKDDTAAIVAAFPYLRAQFGLLAVNKRGAKSVEITDDTLVGIFSVADDAIDARMIEYEDRVEIVGTAGARVAFVNVFERTVDAEAGTDPDMEPEHMVAMIDTSTITPDANGRFPISHTVQRPDPLEITHAWLEPRREDGRVGLTAKFKVNGVQPAPPTVLFRELPGSLGRGDVEAVVDDPDGHASGRFYVAVNHDDDDDGDTDAPDGYIVVPSTPATIPRDAVFNLTAGGTAQLLNDIRLPMQRAKVIYGRLVMDDGREGKWESFALKSAHAVLTDRITEKSATSVTNWAEYALQKGFTAVTRPNNRAEIEAIDDPEPGQRAVADDTDIIYVYTGTGPFNGWDLDEDIPLLHWIPAGYAGFLRVEYLHSTVGDFMVLTVEEELTAYDVVVQGQFTAVDAEIDSLDVRVADIEVAYIDEAYIDDLITGGITFLDLSGLPVGGIGIAQSPETGDIFTGIDGDFVSGNFLVSTFIQDAIDDAQAAAEAYADALMAAHMAAEH